MDLDTALRQLGHGAPLNGDRRLVLETTLAHFRAFVAAFDEWEAARPGEHAELYEALRRARATLVAVPGGPERDPVAFMTGDDSGRLSREERLARVDEDDA